MIIFALQKIEQIQINRNGKGIDFEERKLLTMV